MPILTQSQREKLTFQYTIAVEHGDMDGLMRILAIAEEDVILEQMLLEVNQVLESELSYTQSTPNQEATMPVFTNTKRKRNSSKHPLWTTAVAVLVSILFSGFALFFANQSTSQPTLSSIENIPSVEVDKENLAWQFLEAWNNNSPQTLEDVLADDFLYYESALMPLNKLEIQRRINQLNESFGEVHFMLDEIASSENRLSANLNLKAQHAEMVALDRSYFAEGMIEFVYEGAQIIKVTSSINLDRFSAEYGVTRTDAENELITHIVQEGETMYSIVDQYNIQHTLIPSILEYNGITEEAGAKSITVGTTLQIPDPHSTLILTPPDDFDDQLQSDHIEITDEEVKGLRLYIDVGQANLRLGSLPDTIFMADIENLGEYEYTEHGTVIRPISIINHPYQIFKTNGERPTWYFKLSEKTFNELSIRGGNGDMMLDLGGMWLQDLQVTIGEGELSLNLPDSGINYPVVIKTLSDDATVKLSYPSTVGLRISANDGVWQSRDFASMDSIVTITIDGSLSVLDMLGN